jgi:hypothetical protein
VEIVQHNTENLRSALPHSHPKVDTEHSTGHEIMQYESSFEISLLLTTRVNFEASVVATIKNIVFWDVKQCILVQRGSHGSPVLRDFYGGQKKVGR